MVEGAAGPAWPAPLAADAFARAVGRSHLLGLSDAAGRLRVPRQSDETSVAVTNAWVNMP